MRKKIRFVSAGILAAMLMTGMSLQAAALETETETESETVSIGKKESDEDYQVTFVNESGKEICEIALRASYEEYSDNLLPEGITLKDGEQGTLWVQPAEILNFVPPVYDIQLTFADDETAVLHTLPFGDTEELKVKTDEDSKTVYVDFFSISLNADADSLQSEKNIAASGEDAMIADYRVKTGQASPEEAAASGQEQGAPAAEAAPAPAPAPAQEQCLDNGLMF